MHQNRHNNIYHTCPVCGKRFLVKSNLTKHIQSHSGQNNKAQNCVPPVLYLQNTNVIYFTGQNRKVCSICQNSFSGNSALKTHMLTHSKSKPHQCEKCSKKFVDLRTLERHLKTHMGM